MTPPEPNAIRVTVLRERDEQAPDLDAPTLGMAAVRLERGANSAKIRLTKPAGPESQRSSAVTIYAFSLAEQREQSKLITRHIDLPSSGKPTEITWNGESLL